MIKIKTRTRRLHVRFLEGQKLSVSSFWQSVPTQVRRQQYKNTRSHATSSLVLSPTALTAPQQEVPTGKPHESPDPGEQREAPPDGPGAAHKHLLTITLQRAPDKPASSAEAVPLQL